MRGGGWILSGVLLFLTPFACAEVALLRNGRRLSGTLTFAENRLQFLPADKQTPLSLEHVDTVLFSKVSGPVLSGNDPFVLVLAQEQRLHGEFHELTDRHLQFRPPWGELLAIPREAVHALMQPDGYLRLKHEDFETDLSAWKVSGSVVLDETACFSGKKSLRMGGMSSAELSLPQPLESGKVAILFQDDGHAERAFVELIFKTARSVRNLKCVVGGDSHYHLESAGTPGELGRLPRRAGWHALVVEFAPAGSRLLIDEHVVWAARRDSPGNLVKVRLSSAGAESARIRFDDFTLARAVGDIHHQAADPLQDEVWLASGDQLLGHVLRADGRSVELDARFGKRAWSWGNVRGVYFRRPKQDSRPAAGRTRLWLRVPGSNELDQLVGQVHGLSDRHLSLRHEVLGALEIDRSWIRRIAAE